MPAVLFDRTNFQKDDSMAVVSRTIYDEGRAAKAQGQPDSANPYEAGSQQSLDWLEGFTAGEPEPSATGPDNG